MLTSLVKRGDYFKVTLFGGTGQKELELMAALGKTFETSLVFKNYGDSEQWSLNGDHSEAFRNVFKINEAKKVYIDLFNEGYGSPHTTYSTTKNYDRPPRNSTDKRRTRNHRQEKRRP